MTDPSTELLDLARYLEARFESTGERQVLGIVGAPGTGKSTFARQLADALGQRSVIVPMDGFHLANEIIDGTPLRERKGAIDTFDVGGYLSLLRRLRARDEEVVYAPTYRRGLEEPIAASIAVPQEVNFVISEGNYLLAPVEPWRQIRSILDEIWFFDTPQELRLHRLIERHVAFGMPREKAIAWANGPDETNARFVESTRQYADRVIRGS